MGRFLFSVYSYILHFIKRKDEHSLHSPFLFDFYNKTVLAKDQFLSTKIETERKVVLSDERFISILDLGAKSRVYNTQNQVKTVAQNSLSPKTQAAFLGGVVAYLKPKNILEIGTSFGITTSYLAENAKNATIYTLEGNEETGKMASESFEKLSYQNIKITIGNFDYTLSETLSKAREVDFVFFDGNHRYEPTMRYFEQCLKYISNNCTFVFHDIYWSKEMAKAWKEICRHEKVMLSVDLYFFGIVFFRQNQPKQHFVLKF